MRLTPTAWLLAAIVTLPVSVAAQVTQERDETTVESFGLDAETERPNIAEEAAQGPTSSARMLEPEIAIEEIERTETALSRLRRLVEDTPASDVSRAEYMFRLAELFYDRARFYEQRAYRRRDEAFELRELNPQRARAYEENAQADLDQSDEFASQAINLYADIYTEYRHTYPDIDAVLYYLGANMLQVGQNDAARMVFEDLALNFPQSEYLPQALLMLGELMFVEGDMEQAQMYYEAVTQFPESSGYPYALYKLAWCAYNLAEDDDDFERALQLLYDAIVVTEGDGSPSRVRLRRDALRDMALFYSEVYPADLALDFFNEIAPDEAFDLVARLARIYGDRAAYEASNTLYRTLITLNSQSFDIVEYQREIVRNTRPMANDVEIVRETRRLVEVYQLAQTFEDADPETVEMMGNQIELLIRQLATTYHSEAQTTRNEQYYALAFALYQDYTSAFPESEHAYAMWFYFAELLYRNEEWLQAAEAYERALALSSPQSNQFDQEATYAACLAYANMVDLSAGARGSMGNVAVDEAGLAPTPEPLEIPNEYQRMMNACDRYLATGPEPELAAEIEYVIAYTYYDYFHLDEAVTRFATIATGYTQHDAERGRVSAELLLDALNQQRRYDDMKVWIDRFKADPAINVGSFAVQLQTLSEQIDFIRCNGMFADGAYEDAGQCYIAFVESHFESDLMCRGLYNAGLAFDRGGKFDYSISAMRYLQQYCPNDELAPETTYQLGQTFYRMGMYAEAADQYREYAENNPRGDNVRDALINESRMRAGLRDHGGAVRALEAFIRASDDDEPDELESIAEAYFQIGVVEMERGRDDEAVDAFERVAARYDDVLPGRALESHVMIARIYAGRGDQERALRAYREALEFYDDIDAETRAALSNSARDAAAEAQFMLGEEVFRAFEAIPLEGTEAEVQAAIQEKIDLGRRANELYTVVVDRFARPGWSIAAFTRVGQLYHVFYEQIIDSPVPPGLTPLEAEAYQSSIEAQAEEQKNQAMAFYADAIMIAREFGWFSEYSELAAELYQELDPTFKAGSEVRIEPGLDAGTGPYASPFTLPEELDMPADEESTPTATTETEATDTASVDL